jgi:ribonuclease Z
VGGFLDPNLAFAVPHEIDASDQGTTVYTDGNFEISAFLVDHKPVVPAFGYVIKFHSTKIVVSGDTCLVQSLENQAHNADLLINECFSHPLSQREKSGSKIAAQIVEDLSTYHSDSLELAKMSTRANVKRLVLTHLVPSIPTTDEAKSEFAAGMSDLYKGDLKVANDGDQILVKPVASGGCTIEYLPCNQPIIPVFPRPATEPPTGMRYVPHTNKIGALPNPNRPMTWPLPKCR